MRPPCPGSLYLLRQLGRLHLRFDNLQSDCVAAEVFVTQQLRAVADGEAALAQLGSRLILQAFGVAHYWWRRVCVDRWGRHWRGGGSWRDDGIENKVAEC